MKSTPNKIPSRLFLLTLSLSFSFGGISTTANLLAADRFKAQEPATPAEEFGLTVRSTPHRSPTEARELFHVPDGFVVDLVASEPDIVKPLNMAFDKKGRLWISQTHQYPFPAKEGEPATDSIVVLEDTDGDGDFESRKTFADDLNIPMGLLPVDDGAICFSIPNIWHLKDTDGDGVCDERKILYGPFDTTRDTHGLVNSIRDGGDGWFYACHGFNNQSRVAGTDGHTVWLPSGNVFRFRPDGSRIELYSQGQVNPFGMVQDTWGNWFSADCHSKPISQLIRGGSYQSFGRPHDGLGFAPDIMDHLHGSTAIAGLVHTVDSSFPASMADQLLSGNVMTCRINRNQLVYRGATAKAVELPDLLTSEDSWFRPVDLVFGPDGHLYVADFYNGIIGHYEVPLDHPDRDRTSGRIWRIRWTGDGDSPLTNPAPETSRRTYEVASDWSELDGLNLSVVKDAMKFCRSIQSLSDSKPNEQGIEWFTRNVDRVEEIGDPVAKQTFLIAFRRTLMNLSVHDQPKFTATLENVIESAATRGDSTGERLCHVLLNILPACNDKNCTLASVRLLEKISNRNGAKRRSESIREFQWGIDRIADVVDDESVGPFLELISSLTPAGQSSEDQLLGSARRIESIARRQLSSRGSISGQVKLVADKVIEELASGIIRSNSEQNAIPVPLFAVSSGRGGPDGNGDTREWGYELREVVTKDARGELTNRGMQLQSSFNLGEKYTGKLTTPPFKAPAIFEFSIAGHSGNPPKAEKSTFARLSLWNAIDGSLTPIFQQPVPSNDVAQPVSWQLGDLAGRDIVFEVVDEDSGESYAWIAVGNFLDSRLSAGDSNPRWDMLKKLIELLGAPEQSESLRSLIQSNQLDVLNRFLLLRNQLRSAYPVQTLLTESAINNQHWDLILSDFGTGHAIPKTVSKTSDGKPVIENAWPEAWDKVAPLLFARLSARSQEEVVRQFALNRTSLLKLADWVNSGALPTDVLRVVPQNLWSSLSESELERFTAAREILAQKQDRSSIVNKVLQDVQMATPDRQLGAKVFSEKCAQCHKFGDIGVIVGPQLEGIGNRGIERLLEDILWPDRNVDEAFRVTLILMEDGSSLSGLVTDRNDKTLTLVDQNGKRHAVPVDDIEQEKHSSLSLMPSNMEEIMNAAELASLLEYLRTPATKN